MAIKWMTTNHGPPQKERLLLIVSAAGQLPDGQLIGKSEVKVGFWTGDAFRIINQAEQPIVTRWAKLADFLPAGVELIQLRG
jgi:hypothetical protein